MPDIIDTQYSLDQAGGSEELAKELFEMLLKELPVLREKIQAAINENNMQKMWDHAHKMYGSTAYCGVPLSKQKARELETAIKEEDNIRIEAAFEQASKEIEKVLENGKKVLKEKWN